MKAASALDYREIARRKLPRFLFEYIDGGSYDEVTLGANRDDLKRISLRQRVLRDVSDIDLSTTLFGRRMNMPVALAPIGLAGLAARRGEVQAARAAEAADVPFTARQTRRMIRTSTSGQVRQDHTMSAALERSS